jgi:DNA-binding response OmpR family regulator
MEILLVNPDPMWAERIAGRLRAVGARVSVAENWRSAEAMLNQSWPNIVIVEDRILEHEAAAMVASLRRGDWLPLIVPTDFAPLGAQSERVTVRGEDALRRLEGLVMRLHGAFSSAAQQAIRVGKLTVDTARKEVVFGARRVPLPPHQFNLLLYMALNAGRVVEQRELVREVWGYAGSDNEARELVKAHVRQIRRKLGWTDETDNYLQSVRGFGYILSPPERDKRPLKKSPPA